MYRRFLGSAALVAVMVTLTACPTGTTGTQKASKVSVSNGSNVKAELGAPGFDKPVTITFGSITAAGDVSVDAASAPALPSGVGVNGKFIEITTTAKFDKATACFEDASFTSSTKVLHRESSGWVDVSSSGTPPQACGTFTSFSPIFIGTMTCPGDPAVTVLGDWTEFAKIFGCTLSTPTPTPTRSASPSPTPTPALSPTPTASATGAASPTPTQAQASEAPTEAPTQAPTQAPVTTTAPPAQTTAPPTSAPPTPTPTPAFSAIPRPAVPAKLGIHGRVTGPDGTPIGGACVTLGPPIRCFTFTSNQLNAADTGYFAIDLDALAAPSGSQWDFYVVTGGTYTKVAFAQYYSGKFVVSGVVQKDVKLQ